MQFNICEKVNNRKSLLSEMPDTQFRQKEYYQNPNALQEFTKWWSGILVNAVKRLAGLSACCEKNF
jgi:hypothetical protein